MDKKWLRYRHRVVRRLVYLILGPYSYIRYRIRVDRFKEQGKRAYLILLNHQTPFDQFFVGMSFRGPVYYLASEDLFSNGWISSLIRWLVAPIPIKKQTTDMTAVKNCIRVAREGGTIAIAPEGNRTYSGKTEYMSPAIAGLARKLGLPIALYRIEGGYGAQPRWSDVIRRGKMHSYVSRVIEPEEYATMTNDELFAIIEKELYINEAVADREFLSSKRAEYLERAVYVCPDCGLSTFESHGNEMICKKCGLTVHYGKDKRLSVAGREFPFAFVNDWYEYQQDYVNGLDVTALTDEPMYTETSDLYEVIINKRKNLLCESATIRLYGDRVELSGSDFASLVLPFEEVKAVTVLGRNKLNIYHNDRVYQFKGVKRFNALKYVNIYYRWKNMVKGDVNGKFLGI